MDFKLFDLKYSNDVIIVTVHDVQYLPTIEQFFSVLCFRFASADKVAIKNLNNHSFSVRFSSHEDFNHVWDFIDYFQFLR